MLFLTVVGCMPTATVAEGERALWLSNDYLADKSTSCADRTAYVRSFFDDSDAIFNESAKAADIDLAWTALDRAAGRARRYFSKYKTNSRKITAWRQQRVAVAVQHGQHGQRAPAAPVVRDAPAQCVMDTLHLLLRGADYLIDDFVVRGMSLCAKMRNSQQAKERWMARVTEGMAKCGVAFHFWQAQQEDGTAGAMSGCAQRRTKRRQTELDVAHGARQEESFERVTCGGDIRQQPRLRPLRRGQRRCKVGEGNAGAH